MYRYSAIVVLFVWAVCTAQAQKMAIRNNLLYDATLTPNIGVEARIDSTWSAGVDFGMNAWDIDKDKNKKWRHLLIAPHVRKYMNFRNKAYRYMVGYENGQLVCKDSLFLRRVNYLELDVIYSHFNVGNTRIPFGLYSGVKNRRLQGDLLAIGAKYGYSWMLGRDWRLEAEAGIAVGYAWYKEYDCATCGTFYGKDSRLFLLPLLGININYIIDWKNK